MRMHHTSKRYAKECKKEQERQQLCVTCYERRLKAHLLPRCIVVATFDLNLLLDNEDFF